jgi:hypothetical protein
MHAGKWDTYALIARIKEEEERDMEVIHKEKAEHETGVTRREADFEADSAVIMPKEADFEADDIKVEAEIGEVVIPQAEYLQC